MLTGSIRGSWLRLGVLGGLLGLLTPAASAQDAGQVAQACVRAVRTVALETSSDVQTIAGNTADRVRAIDENGGSDLAIRAAGQQGRQHVDDRAGAGLERVRTLTDACVATLQDMGAPPALIARVVNAARDARGQIATSRDRGHARIDHAVRVAINN